MQDPNTFTTKEQWYDWVKSDEFDVTPPHNRAVFHSSPTGFTMNMRDAARWIKAQDKGHVTVGMVKDGITLNKADLYTRYDGKKEDIDYVHRVIWGKASEKYAKSASGAVTCFVRRDEARSIFREIELPALLKNDKVTYINGIPRKELERIFDLDKSKNQQESLREIHEQIAKAEPKTLEPAKREEQKTFLDRDKGEESKQPSKETDGQRDKEEQKKTEPSKQEQDRLLSRIIVKEIDSDRADKRHFEVVLPSEKKLIFEMDAKAKGATPDRIKEGISFEKLNKLEAKQEGEIVNVNVKPRKPQSVQQLMREQDQEYERSR